MQRYVISTGTITYAIKGRDLLRNLGYKAAVERRIGGAGNIGCGYVIIFQGDIKKAEAALKGAGVKVLKINNE